MNKSGGGFVHIEQVPKSNSIQKRALHSDHENREVSSIDELLERARKFTESVRNRTKELYGKIRILCGSFGDRQEREQRIEENIEQHNISIGKIDKTERDIGRTEQIISGSKQSIEITTRAINQTERSITQADKALDRKNNKGWGMSK